VYSNFTSFCDFGRNGSRSGFECQGAQYYSLGSYYCPNPITGILFDGIVPGPTLAVLNDNTWARQLLTVPTTPDLHVSVTYDFTNMSSGYAALGRVEVVLFNCPEWQISVQTIRFFDAVNGAELDTFHLPNHVTSCNSLVRVCRVLRAFPYVRQLEMQFYPHPDSRWVHLAEVTFHSLAYVGTECPPVPAPPITTAATESRNIAYSKDTSSVVSMTPDSKKIACTVL
jgi:hypothetical protein